MIAEIIGTEHQRAAFAKALPHDAFKCQSVKQARPSVGKTLLGSVMNIIHGGICGFLQRLMQIQSKPNHEPMRFALLFSFN